MMANVLVVETFAEDTFEWAQQLLGDPGGECRSEARCGTSWRASRATKSPHVDYLTVALSELRARTLIGTDGEEFAGAEVVDASSAGSCAAWRPSGRAMARDRMQRRNPAGRSRMRHAQRNRRKRFEELDSGWAFPHADDEALDVLLTAA